MDSLPSKQTQVLHRVQGRILLGTRGTIHARTVHGTWRLGAATQPKRSSSRKDGHAGLATRADLLWGFHAHKGRVAEGGAKPTLQKLS